MTRLLNAACAATLLVSGCVATTGPSSSTAEPVANPSTASTPTTRVSYAPATPETFESTLYPYSLTLPVGVATRRWHAATRPWDGVSRFASESRDGQSPSIDDNGTPDGGLFIIGTPTSETLEAFVKRVADNQSRFHGCAEPTAIRPVVVAGDPATSFVQTCADNTVAVRVVTIHAGFGFAANIQSDDMPPAKRPTVQADLVSWLGGLVWR
jgi:hypothetical protein